MKLVDLHPNWIISRGGIGVLGERRGMGIIFDCPVHASVPPADSRCGCLVGVMFENPIDGGPKCDASCATRNTKGEPVYWQRTGETFETLTLAPSIRVFDVGSGPNGEVVHTTHWHGFITNGEVRNA